MAASVNKENYQLYKRYVKNIRLVYQKRKDVRAYIELLLSLSVTVIFVIFAIRPTIITMIELDREIEEKESVLQRLETKIENLDKAQLLSNQNRTTINLLDLAVPDGALPETYARQIEGLARRHQVNLAGLTTGSAKIAGASSFNPQERSFPSNSDDVEISIDITGSYDSLMQFLLEFENMRRPMHVDILNLRNRGNQEDGELLISIVGRIPYIPN